MSLNFIKVELSNFKSFVGDHELELDVGPGLVFVTGRNEVEPDLGANGAGKSTIWDAIFWCLYGKTIRSERPSSSIEPRGLKESVSVSVTFERDGRRGVVTRTRRPNSLSLKRRGSVTEVDQGVVDDAIGLSDSAFRRTILMGQFGDLFLDLKPAEQSALFTEVLNLDQWLKAAEVASAQAKKADARVLTFKEKLAGLTGQLTEVQGQQLRTETARDAWVESHKAALEELEVDLQEADVELKRVSKLTPKLPTEVPSPPPELISGDKDLAALRLVARDASRKNVEAESQVSGLLSTLRGLRADVDKYQAVLDSKKIVCPECKQAVGRDHIIEKRDAASLAHATMDQRLGVARNAVDMTVAAAAKADKAVNTLEGNLKALRRAYDKARDTYTAAVTAHQVASKTLNRAQQTVATLEARISERKGQKNPHIQALVQLTQRLKDVGLEYAEVDAEYKPAVEEAERFRYWIGAFREIRLSLITEALTELEMTVNRHAAGLGLIDWEIRFVTERENKSGNVSIGFSAMIYPPDMSEPEPWESYSGGESQRWQVAVTLGLSEVLLARAGVAPNMEIFDEPTQHLSAQGIDDTLEHLQERALELNRTIYFVDHRSLDKGAFTSTLFVVKDESGSRFVME